MQITISINTKSEAFKKMPYEVLTCLLMAEKHLQSYTVNPHSPFDKDPNLLCDNWDLVDSDGVKCGTVDVSR